MNYLSMSGVLNTLRHAFIIAALDAGVPLRDAQGHLACGPARDDAPERARSNLDRHATYIVAAYVAGAAREWGTSLE